MSWGGLQGIGDRLFVIPRAALTLDTDRNCLVPDIDATGLKSAASLDQDHWPAMAEFASAGEVHSYYGQREYYARRDEVGDRDF